MRDPLIDPEPDDVVMDARSEEVHVHFVRHGQVYVGWWKHDTPGRTVRVSIQRWREECAQPGVRVIQRAEEAR